MIVRLTAAAQADIREARDWYRARQDGLESRFLAAVHDGLGTVGEQPRVGPPVEGEIRRHLLRGFPYGLFYVERGEELVVIACMHGARDPARWQSRGAG